MFNNIDISERETAISNIACGRSRPENVSAADRQQPRAGQSVRGRPKNARWQGPGSGEVCEGGGAAFGELLRALRLARSLTLEGLAERSGVSARGIGDLERGRRASPQRRTVAALAEGLQLAHAERKQLLDAARARRAPEEYRATGVRSLPRSIDDFIGREKELAVLAELAELARVEGAPGQAVVVVVSGPPGVGKTNLALRAACQLEGRFPDGQLVVDLCGADEEAPTPAELILGLLRTLGVPNRDLLKAGPAGHPELYRRILADRRSLLLLDNARDEAQVRPLLPGTGSSMVMVTSRRMLTGLDNVHRLPICELSERESAAFLTSLVGSERASVDPPALADVAQRCGHLPLALRVVGNWLATRTGWTARRLADRLALEDRRLEALTAGDLCVTNAFDLSYRRLDTDAARMFRRLALVPGPDVSGGCAAQITGQDPFDAEDTLEELVEAGLLCADGSRYRLHDLLRLYARARLHAEEEPRDIDAARATMYRWLLETAVLAGRRCEFDHGDAFLTWEGTPELSDADEAAQWLQAEGLNWLAALRAAAAAGDHLLVVKVAEGLRGFSRSWIFWAHWPEVFGIAARSAQHLSGPDRGGGSTGD
ncbi:helix-turn-helix domain-containing protein [Streptomyces sp. NPDC097617]|uniref:helix-turn-helix domain-containing protein n=1 Tax=Streptomyces sp. NPDC097617 TaxID=3366091 RepID=UPI003822B8E7